MNLVYLLPAFLAFLLGALYGRKMKIPGLVIPITLITGLIASWYLGPYIFYTRLYNNLPFALSEIYLSALLGMVIASKKEIQRR